MDEFHEGQTPKFSFKMLATHRSSLQRQLMEAISIAETVCDIKMNKKGEWGINMIPTMGVMVLGGMGDWEETPESQGVQKGGQQGDRGDQGNRDENGDIMTFTQRRKRRKMYAETEGTQEPGDDRSQGVPRSPSRRAENVSLGVVSGARKQDEHMKEMEQADRNGSIHRKRKSD